MSEARRRPLTPHEIRNLRIRRIGLRKGYEPGAVEELLQRLADDAASREHTINDLANRLDRAETEAYARRHGTLPAAPNQARLDDLLADVHSRLRAQQYAEELIASAQRGAAQIVAQGREQASQILHEAHRAAEQAARDYRAEVGAGYRPDQEELARLLGLTQWAQSQLAALHQQITTTNSTVCQELASIIERLHPAVAGEPASPQDAPDLPRDPSQPNWSAGGPTGATGPGGSSWADPAGVRR